MSDNYPMGYSEPIDFDTYLENKDSYIKDLESQLAEAREALRDFSKAYSENFNTTQLLVKHIKVLEQLKEQGDE